MHNFLTDNKIIKVEAATAAGTTDIESAIVDTFGFEECTFVTTVLAITSGAVTSMKAQQDTDAAGATMADLEDSGITIADDDDNQTFAVSIYRPFERYLRCVIDRATQNAAFGEIYAVLSKPTTPGYPVSNNRTDEITSQTIIEPEEGTP